MTSDHHDTLSPSSNNIDNSVRSEIQEYLTISQQRRWIFPLVLGALIGLAMGQIVHNLLPDIVPIPAVFAVVGMAAYFTAIVRAPLTGIMLIVEMTGNYNQMLPLLVSCFCAYAVAEYLKDPPIYEALLERDLRRSSDALVLREPVVVEFTIRAGAPFVGLEVRSLGLPPGCILVRCSDGEREWIPKANTPWKRICALRQ